MYNTSLRQCLHKLFKFFYQGHLLAIPIYLSNHSFIPEWTHGYLFHTLGYNPILAYLFSPSNSSRFSHEKLFHLVPVSLDISPSLLFLFSFFFLFLLPPLLPSLASVQLQQVDTDGIPRCVWADLYPDHESDKTLHHGLVNYMGSKLHICCYDPKNRRNTERIKI